MSKKTATYIRVHLSTFEALNEAYAKDKGKNRTEFTDKIITAGLENQPLSYQPKAKCRNTHDELLEALENLVFYTSQDGVNWTTIKEAIIKGRQAIAKAEGK